MKLGPYTLIYPINWDLGRLGHSSLHIELVVVLVVVVASGKTLFTFLKGLVY